MNFNNIATNEKVEERKQQIIQEINKRFDYLLRKNPDLVGILISTDEGFSISGVGKIIESNPKLASISAVFVHLFNLLSMMMKDEKNRVEAHYYEHKILIFTIGNFIFTVIMKKEGDIEFIQKNIEKMFVMKKGQSL